MIATIMMRDYQNNRNENSRISWLGRTLAQYISAGYMMDEKTENTALKEARLLSIDNVERLLLEEQVDKPKTYENKNGSFERLTGSFGA